MPLARPLSYSVETSQILVFLRKGDKPLKSPSSYCPLCLLNSTGKLFEKLLETRIKEDLARGDDLADCQFGFREGRSTICAVKKLLSHVESSTGKKVGLLTFDVKNAFNSASWEKILDAAEGKGVSPRIMRVIRDYFKDRTLLVTINGAETILPVTSGVPQGSVFGPTLWNIMYDDLFREPPPTGVEFLAYADDVTLVASGKDVGVLERLLTEGADTVVKWMNTMGFELAIQKSEAMVITKTRTYNDLRINIGGVDIKNVSKINYLGIVIDHRLNFNVHAVHVTAKAGKVARNLARILPERQCGHPEEAQATGRSSTLYLIIRRPNMVGQDGKIRSV